MVIFSLICTGNACDVCAIKARMILYSIGTHGHNFIYKYKFTTQQQHRKITKKIKQQQKHNYNTINRAIDLLYSFLILSESSVVVDADGGSTSLTL